MTVAVWELTTGGAVGVKDHCVCVFTTVGGCGCRTDVIDRVSLHKGSLDRCSATVKHAEAVFTYSSPRSSAPGSDRDGAAIN